MLWLCSKLNIMVVAYEMYQILCTKREGSQIDVKFNRLLIYMCEGVARFEHE